MKATLNFDLSDSEQRKEHLRCVLSTNMAIVLWEINTNCYKKLEDDDSYDFNEGIEKALEYMRCLMEENGININELID